MNSIRIFQKLPPKVVFRKLSPFEAAFYNMDTNRIIIDKKFKGSKAVKNIIEHEKVHANSLRIVDIKHDITDMNQLYVTWEVIKKKPLCIFNFLIPIDYYEERGKKYWGIQIFKLLTLILFITSLIILGWVFL